MEMDPCDTGGQIPTKVSEKPIQQDSEDVGVKKPPIESPATIAASSGLVYVRRRVEVDTAKGAAANPPPKAVAISSPRSSSSPHGPTTTSISHKLDWEERYHHLQMLLNKLNESDQTDHLQMLWSLSSSELSKHAVELEKRSIQFSLEEAREMQRVAALNILGSFQKARTNVNEIQERT